MNPDNAIKVYFVDDVEDYISDEVLQQLYDTQIYAFVADNGREQLELAYGPTLNEGKLIPLVSNSPIEVRDNVTSIAAASSAMRGTPLYLVKLVVSDVVYKINGHNIATEDTPHD